MCFLKYQRDVHIFLGLNHSFFLFPKKYFVSSTPSINGLENSLFSANAVDGFNEGCSSLWFKSNFNLTKIRVQIINFTHFHFSNFFDNNHLNSYKRIENSPNDPDFVIMHYALINICCRMKCAWSFSPILWLNSRY